ncbi:MAG TPA: FtsX-like permease family protein [Mycobacteriales bacterium]|nr:FtsX-like permease family protein [Mycobacteriales bacterium]
MLTGRFTSSTDGWRRSRGRPAGEGDMLRVAYWLNLRQVRRRPLRAVLAVISIAAGASLGVSVLVMTVSVSAGFHSFGRQLAGPAPLRVVGATSSGGLADSVLPAVAHTLGVKTAIPLVQVVTYAGTASDPHAETIVALGVDCRVQALFGRFGCTSDELSALSNAGGVVVSPRLASKLGPGASIQTDAAPVPLRSAVQLPALNAMNHGYMAIFALQDAQRLFARAHRLDVIYVIPSNGIDVHDLRTRLQAAVGDWNGVLTATDPPPAVGVYTDTIIPLFALLSLFALAVGGMLIFNISSLAMEERRRELALVAALGGTARVVRTGAALEGGALGLVGGLIGVGGGTLLAHPLTASLSKFTTVVVGVGIPVKLTAGSVVAGIMLGAIVGAAAALASTRRVGRIDVVAELSMREETFEAQHRRDLWRATAYLAFCGAGIAVCWLAQRHGSIEPWQAKVAPLGVLIATVASLLASAALASVIAAALSRLTRRLDGPVRLGVANLARQGRRAGVMAISIGAAVTTAFVIGSTQSAAKADIAQSVETGHIQELYVSTLEPNNTVNVEAKPTEALARQLARIPGVARIDRSVFELSGHETKHLVGVNAGTLPWLNAPLIEGTKSPASFAAGKVLIGAALARDTGARPGSTLPIDTPSGRASVTVGGIWEDGNLGGRDITMSMTLYRHLFGNQPAQSFGVVAQQGVSLVELADRIRSAHLLPGLIVEDPSQFSTDVASSVNDQLAPFTAMQRGLLFVAFVAVLSTLLLVGVQRRRELGLLAAVGMEPAQLARMTLAEGISAGVIGLALAFVGSLIIEFGFYLVLPIIIGFKDPLRFDFVSFFVWSAVSLALVAAASVLPAWRNARVPVLESLQYE